MRTLARYVLLMSAAVGVAWASVSVEVQGRTPYGHFRAAGGGRWMEAVRSGWMSARTSLVDQWAAWTAASEDEAEDAPASPAKRRPTPAKKPARRAAEPPTVQEDDGAARRVAILRSAEQKAAPARRSPPPKRTRVDGPMSPKDRAALDRVVSGR